MALCDRSRLRDEAGLGLIERQNGLYIARIKSGRKCAMEIIWVVNAHSRLLSYRMVKEILMPQKAVRVVVRATGTSTRPRYPHQNFRETNGAARESETR